MKQRDQEAESKKKRDEEMLKKQEEDARLKKEAEEAALPEEERVKIQMRKEADAIKAQGNDFYKKRQFTEALQYYQQAIDRCPEELTFINNKATCFYEMK